nr:MAG TPA: hypothetical protein [Caudoviricetes sp.]
MIPHEYWILCFVNLILVRVHSLTIKRMFYFPRRNREPTLRCSIFLREHSLLSIGDKHILLLMNSFIITAGVFVPLGCAIYS